MPWSPDTHISVLDLDIQPQQPTTYRQPTKKQKVSKLIRNFNVRSILDPPQRASILAMPPEISNRIMDFVFEDCHVLLKERIGSVEPPYFKVHGQNLPFGLLLSCRKLRIQALPFLRNTHLRILEEKPAPDLRHEISAVERHDLARRLPHALKGIVGSLALRVEQIDSSLLKELPNLQTLIVTGCQIKLNQVIFNLQDLPEYYLRELIEDLFATGPLRRVLRLRADSVYAASQNDAASQKPLKLAFEIYVIGPNHHDVSSYTTPFSRVRIKYDFDGGKLSVNEAAYYIDNATHRDDLNSRAQWCYF